MKIKAYIVTTDQMNYPDAPDYSNEFDVLSTDDIVSNVEKVLHTFKGIYPDSIVINAYDDDDPNGVDDTIFEYETEKKNEKLTDVMDDLLSEIRKIELENIFK